MNRCRPAPPRSVPSRRPAVRAHCRRERRIARPARRGNTSLAASPATTITSPCQGLEVGPHPSHRGGQFSTTPAADGHVDQTGDLVSQVVHVTWQNFSASSNTNSLGPGNYPVHVYECDRADPVDPGELLRRPRVRRQTPRLRPDRRPDQRRADLHRPGRHRQGRLRRAHRRRQPGTGLRPRPPVLARRGAVGGWPAGRRAHGGRLHRPLAGPQVLARRGLLVDPGRFRAESRLRLGVPDRRAAVVRADAV